MKKLLIATMAAVSVGLCAKAADDTGFISGTSFEGLTEGEAFDPNDTYWTIPTDTDDEFKITNVTYSADAIPQHWDLTTGEMALSIDTANPILRNVNPEPSDDTTNPPQDVTNPVFFDSVVQFTATDVAGEPSANDKLRVWLYTSPDDVSETNPGLFKETATKKTLVITAGVLETNNGVQSIVKKDYDTGKEIEPDSWHRLTIKSFIESDENSSYYGRLVFNVWVDGQLVSVDGVKDFLSLVDAKIDKKLQGVAFDGKGAVDDIVFTTNAPEFTKEPEAETANVTITFNNLDAIMDVEQGGIVFTAGDDEHNIYDTATNFVLTVGTTAKLQFMLNEEFELESPDISPNGEGVYTITIDSLTTNGDTIAIVTKVATGGGSGEEPEPEVPAKPTVGGVEVVVDANGKITNITTADNGKAVTGTIKDDMFADYYAVSVDTDGKLVIAIDPVVATPQINATSDDADDAIVVTDAAVALGVTNAKAGLWYGAQAYSDAACTTPLGVVTGWEQATGETVTVTATKPEGDKAFFKVVVDDQDHTPAEEQN